MKRGSFKIDGINSEDLHTVIQNRPLIETPSRKVSWRSSYGGDGQIPFDERAYDNTKLELLFLTNGDDLIGDRQEFFNVMDTKGIYRDLIPYFDPNKIYRVMLEGSMQFENKHFYGNAQSSSATFTVKPYKYLVGVEPSTFTVKSFNMVNPTNYVAQPIIRLEGSGDVTISVNGVDFLIRDMPSKLTIDSERYQAYTEGATGPLQSMNNKIMTREYPIFEPGNNNVVITGSITKTEIDPRWRSLV